MAVALTELDEAGSNFVDHRHDVTLASSDATRRQPSPELALPFLTMTAKEKLRERVEALTEQEAAETLRLLDQRTDPVSAAFRDAPLDDEPLTPEEEQALEESRAEYRRGEGVPLDEIRHEFT